MQPLATATINNQFRLPAAPLSLPIAQTAANNKFNQLNLADKHQITQQQPNHLATTQLTAKHCRFRAICHLLTSPSLIDHIVIVILGQRRAPQIIIGSNTDPTSLHRQIRQPIARLPPIGITHRPGQAHQHPSSDLTSITAGWPSSDWPDPSFFAHNNLNQQRLG